MDKTTQQEEIKKFIIVQVQPKGEVALTKPDLYENIAASFKRFQFIEIPYIKIVEHIEWKRKNKEKIVSSKKKLDI